MIIQKNAPFYKREIRVVPTKQNGAYIKYMLASNGISLVDISKKLNTSYQMIQHVIYGRRRSRRVEAEIARLLGAESWNHLVTEANLVVSGAGNPTKTQIDKALKDRLKKREQLINQKRNAFKPTLKEAV